MSRLSRSFVASIFALATLTACGTSVTFRVLEPAAPSAGTANISITGNKIQIRVVLNLPIAQASVLAKTNVMLSTPLASNVDIGTTLEGTLDNELVVTSTADASTLLNAGVANNVTLKLLGSGDNPLRSVSGRELDQDSATDGNQDYETTFSLTPS